MTAEQERLTRQDREIVEALLAGATFPSAPHVQRALNEVDALQAELQAAQEREKVLRGWLRGEGWSETNIDGLLLLAAQRTEEPRRTSADDYAAFARGVRRHDRLTYHDEFARCPDCQHATVGLQPPYAINHGGACPSVAALPQRTEEPSE